MKPSSLKASTPLQEVPHGLLFVLLPLHVHIQAIDQILLAGKLFSLKGEQFMKRNINVIVDTDSILERYEEEVLVYGVNSLK